MQTRDRTLKVLFALWSLAMVMMVIATAAAAAAAGDVKRKSSG